MSINILMIEDEIAICDMLQFSLPDEMAILFAHTIEAARLSLFDQTPSIILLDWMLPDQSGIDFIRWIKKQEAFRQIPIIMLTAKAEEDNKVNALTVGADDYITKPFSPREVCARIHAVLRRAVMVSPDQVLSIGALSLNLQTCSCTVNEKLVHLTANEFKLLHFFMMNTGKVFRRDQLISQIWGVSHYVEERTIDVMIRRLRNKLKPFHFHSFIKTLRGQGYQSERDF